MERLEYHNDARKLLQELLAYTHRLMREKARVDYFATSLPALLLFEDDMQAC